MTEKPDELWVGLQGPIRISDEDDPQRARFREAGRIAQAATSREELIRLVMTNSDPLVRLQAVPRLKARFLDDAQALETLIQASHDSDSRVRLQVFSALADFEGTKARDALRRGLDDESSKVRLIVGTALQALGDEMAPRDPEAWAYDPLGMSGPPHDDGPHQGS